MIWPQIRWQDLPQMIMKISLILTIFVLSTAHTKDEGPTLRKCCLTGLKYDDKSNSCVDPEEYPGFKAGISSEEVQKPSLVPKIVDDEQSLEGNTLSIPMEFVLDLQNDSIRNPKFSFGLSPSELPSTSCADGYFIVDISLGEIFNGAGANAGKNTSSSNGDIMNSGNRPSLNNNGTDKIVFTSRGHLKLGAEYYAASEFCIFNFRNKILSLRVCHPTCSGLNPCIRKCCDLHKVWNVSRGEGLQTCVSTHNKNFWSPQFYKSPLVKASEDEMNQIEPHYQIVHPRTFCRHNLDVPIAVEHRLQSGQYFSFRVGVTGAVFRRHSRYTWDSGTFTNQSCVDGLINSRFAPEEEYEYSGLPEDEVLFECLPSVPDKKSGTSRVYAITMIFASIFLILTILVYILLWGTKKQRSAGRMSMLTLLSYLISLTLFYVCLISMHLYTSQITLGQDSSLCYFIAVALNFCMVATFCWMSAVCFDIVRALKLEVLQNVRSYIVYSFFCWSVPIAIVGVALVLDQQYRNDYDSKIIIPEYGVQRCHLDSEYAQLAYAYGPSGTLLAFNVVCFLVTVCTLYKRRKAEGSSTENSKQHRSNQLMKLFIKLLVIMGIPWVFEFISWYIEKDNINGTSWYWAPLDFLIIFQPLAIFWIFVCTPEVIYDLEEKYSAVRKFFDLVLLQEESAKKILERFPWLKGIVEPITRKKRQKQTCSTNTDSDWAETTVRRTDPEHGEVKQTEEKCKGTNTGFTMNTSDSGQLPGS